ncbi:MULTISPECIES: IS66 family insertion sequence element accessory protein TnpB [unclassified Mesorhizobium]|uniref:IS66 family insertion sequence element accessory protein TnpB n=1 Tax=unclassified Mesorhizobium TaxID=325217 RepID=UPI0021E1E0E9|nr:MULTISPECIES: IS66 family insertion sequence element accessory protein TnpB [unclassified Mesorhizobium]
MVREKIGADPFSGAVYVFRAKRTDRIKLIFWDATRVCIYAKRLEDGEFRWPKVQDGVMRLTAAQLSALLEGLDWRRVLKPAGRLLRRRRLPSSRIASGPFKLKGVPPNACPSRQKRCIGLRRAKADP